MTGDKGTGTGDTGTGDRDIAEVSDASEAQQVRGAEASPKGARRECGVKRLGRGAPSALNTMTESSESHVHQARADTGAPVIEPGHTFGSITDKIGAIVVGARTPLWWFFGFAVSFTLLMMLMGTITYLVTKGVGIWGINIPVGWGFDIINFVWWIGIGHAGTLISAILLLLRQDWRTSINRFAEAMTLFAVACAMLYPLFHTGRPWLAYWMLPYPNTMGLWPQFRSPLIWDVFAVTTYATVSALFWFVGLIPDLATLRDRSSSRFARIVYGSLAMGWRGSARHWHRYETAYLLLAGLATPLVISVHTRRELRLRRRGHPRLARDDLSALLRGGRHLRRASRWCSRWRFRCAGCTGCRTSSPNATSRTWRRSSWSPGSS